MKKLLITTLSLMTVSSFAGTSATLNLQGTIQSVIDISIESESLATNLPLDQAVSSQKVGKVVEKSNSATGYKVSVASSNGGKLVRSGDASSFINYQLSYNNSIISLNSNATQISSNASHGQFERDLAITYAKPSDYTPSGIYADVVTFTIAVN